MMEEKSRGKLVGHGCASRLLFSEPDCQKRWVFAHFARSVAGVNMQNYFVRLIARQFRQCPQQSIGRSSPQTSSPYELVSSLLQMNINIRIIVTPTFAAAGARKLSRLPFTVNRLSSMSLGQLETSDIVAHLDESSSLSGPELPLANTMHHQNECEKHRVC